VPSRDSEVPFEANDSANFASVLLFQTRQRNTLLCC